MLDKFKRLIRRWWRKNVCAPDPWELLPGWTCRLEQCVVELVGLHNGGMVQLHHVQELALYNGRRRHGIPLTRFQMRWWPVASAN